MLKDNKNSNTFRLQNNLFTGHIWPSDHVLNTFCISIKYQTTYITIINTCLLSLLITHPVNPVLVVMRTQLAANCRTDNTP